MRVRFTAEIDVEGLSEFAVPEAYQERHEIFQSLLWHKYTAREISDYLNKLGYRTSRGGDLLSEVGRCHDIEAEEEAEECKSDRSEGLKTDFLAKSLITAIT